MTARTSDDTVSSTSRGMDGAASPGLGWTLINLLQAVTLAAITAVLVSLACLSLLVSRELPLWMARELWARSLLFFAGVRLEITGLEHVDRSRVQLFVANHTSMMDIAVVFRALPVNLRYILKKELKWVPFVGQFAWATGMIFVDRKNRGAAFASLRKVGALSARRGSIIAFPEGTRSRGQGILPFKKGVFVAALDHGLPIVPVAIEGAERVLPTPGFRVRPGLVRVRIGAPIETKGREPKDRDAVVTQARDALVALHDGLVEERGC